MKPTIAFDCDGVILSWRHGFGQHVQDRLGLTLGEEDFRHGDCSDYPTLQQAGINAEGLDDLLDSYFEDGPAILEDPLIPQCWDWLQQWAEPVVVTNRPKGCSTEAKLAQLGLDAPVINNVGIKAGWKLLIDDWYAHCQSNGASGGQSIQYRQPWSGGAYDPSVGSWGELAALLEQVMATEKAEAMPRGPSGVKRAPPNTTQDYHAFMRKRYAMMAGQLSLLDTEDTS